MKDVGGEYNSRELWYRATEDGQPDFSHPMTDPERVQAYWESASSHPELLADLYVNFHRFNTVEFTIFKDRLSAAILRRHRQADLV